MWPLPPCCCGCEKAAAAEAQPDQTLQRPRRCPPPALAGSLVGWRRRTCRGGPHHVLPPGKKPTPPSPPGLRRSWRRGRPRPRRGGCHPLEEAAARGGLWTACSGRSGRQPPREGCSGRQPPPPGGGTGSGSTAARPRSARTLGAGEAGSRAGAAFPDLAGRAHGARDVKHYSRSVRISARGHPGGECALLPSTGSLGGHRGWRPEAGGQRSSRRERCGPGTCGKEWPPDCIWASS